MYKKFTMAFMVMTALLAVALPASASATNDPTLTEGGTDVAVGTKFVGTNLGLTYLLNTATSSKTTQCTGVVLAGTLLKNSEGTIEGTIETASFFGTAKFSTCTSVWGIVGVKFATPLCLRSNPTMATDEFQIEGSDCAGTQSPVVVHINECEYETTGTIKGDYTTSSDDANLTLRHTAESGMSLKKGGGFLCPNSTVFAWVYSLETENGAKLTIS